MGLSEWLRKAAELGRGKAPTNKPTVIDTPPANPHQTLENLFNKFEESPEGQAAKILLSASGEVIHLLGLNKDEQYYFTGLGYTRRYVDPNNPKLWVYCKVNTNLLAKALVTRLEIFGDKPTLAEQMEFANRILNNLRTSLDKLATK